MSHKLLGLPYDEWIDAFLPMDDSEVDYMQYNRLFDGVVVDGKESDMYEPLVNALNGTDILGDFVLAETYARYDKSDKDKKKADGGMYPKGSSAIEQKRTDWATVEVFIECKTNDSGDPYDENTLSGIPYAETRRDALGQITTYASTVFEYQHLTHHFGVVVLGSQARLGRWDHSGIVFSYKFDYKEEPAKLARFFWRVAHATPEARGHDSTATRILPGSADYKTLEAWKAKELAEDDYVARRFVKSLTEHRPWWRLTVADGTHGKKDFLVGQPTFAASGVVGRCTRGYIALSVSSGHGDSPFVYLKDCWRVVHERSELEGDILSYLNGKGVANIPTALYHGDVEDHRTISQDFCKCAKAGCVSEVVEGTENQIVGQDDKEKSPVEEWAKAADENLGKVPGGTWKATGAISSGPNYQSRESQYAERSNDLRTDVVDGNLTALRCRMKAHRHYRLVVEEVGLPLQEFPCGRILVWAIRDAVIAHQDAYTKARVMHRDISVGNILIIPPNSKNKKATHQGLLADWELSKRLDDYAAGARHPDRTGTWQFMSVYIQDHPESQVEIADELESFLHVLIYCAIRYLPHTCENVGDFMHHYFDDGVRKQETDYTCGLLKATIIKNGELITRSHVPIIFLRRHQASPGDPDSQPVESSQLLKKSSNLWTKPATVSKTDRHPINRVITSLLECFAARYSLLYPKLSEEYASEDDEDFPNAFSFSKALGGDKGALRAHNKLISTLTSKLIESHIHMIELLSTASDEMAHRWPGPEDRLADQLDPGFNPSKAEKVREKRAAPAAKPGPQPASKRPRSTTLAADPGEQPASKRLRGSASRG
ncbi:hypothetical protein PYCCODRAFT_1469564 [Trametes coccinea BRFM310]|uniref:Fungal-type protein kinase domain-containing protein n=1 Tax=Trametes coccinea (strain BRFM310) TaxID=1353009 RepID=A0A1Y2IGM3_TRAC3|nr:hypothetical protein PYCCODRAFT_1469564 [Trametes coccinea BRFM310]